MSHLSYYSYEGFGQIAKANTGYSQALRIDNRIEISGQGGWNRADGTIPTDLATEFEQAFANVDHTLKSAGGAGWSQVYKIRAYFAPLDERNVKLFVAALKRWSPDHQPLLTAVGVAQLAFDMHVEIEAEAQVRSTSSKQWSV